MNARVPEKLYNLLRTKFDSSNIKLLDANAKETTEIDDARMFSFDFRAGNHNYGPIVILISGDETLEIYYGDNTSKTLDTDARKKWENLIEHLSTFACTNRLGFSLKHTTDLKYDLSNVADITESYKTIFEGYYGTSRTSYNKQGKAKIIIKHSKALGEDDKRFRYINSIFIENADGERFKLPFRKLTGARAMARHVTEGGNPYDLFGLHISEMVNDINTLGGFVRRSKMYEGNDEALGLVETGRQHYNTLRKNLKQIAGKRGYRTYKENWEPTAITEQDTDTDAIRKLFTEVRVDKRTEDALPLLARLQKMAEADDGYGNEWDETKYDCPEEDPNYDGPIGGLDWDWDNLTQDEKENLERMNNLRSKHLKDNEVSGPATDIDWPDEVKSDEFPGDYHPDQDDWGDEEDLDENASKKSNRENTMKEISEFEEWADGIVEGDYPEAEKRAVFATLKKSRDDSSAFGKPKYDAEIKKLEKEKVKEGTWALPDTDEQIQDLKDFMSEKRPVGVDALNVTDELYDIIGDDDLYDRLANIADDDPEADARPVVKDFIEQMYKERDMYDDEDAINIKNMYRAIKKAKALALGEECNDLDADNDTQLNASVNKNLDRHAKRGANKTAGYVQETDDDYADNEWNDESFYYDHNPDEDEDMLGSTLNHAYRTESTDFDELMQLTKTLLKK